MVFVGSNWVSKRMVLAGIGLLILIGAGVGFFWPFNNNSILRLAGIVEIQEVRLGSKLGGRVARVLVEEGQTVKPGQELVVFESPELQAQRDQLQAKLMAAEAELEKIINGPRQEEIDAALAAADAAKARYDRMLKGWREEEIKQAASELESAEADLKQAEEDYRRISNLYTQKSVARADFDAAFAARDRARGRASAASAKYTMLKRGNRPEDKAEAKAEWLKAKAKADEAQAGSRWEDIAQANANVADMRAKLQEVLANLKEA